MFRVLTFFGDCRKLLVGFIVLLSIVIQIGNLYLRYVYINVLTIII